MAPGPRQLRKRFPVFSPFCTQMSLFFLQRHGHPLCCRSSSQSPTYRRLGWCWSCSVDNAAVNGLKETSACDVALCGETAIVTKAFCTPSSPSILTASLLGDLTLLQERKMLWEGTFLAASPGGSGVFCDSRVLALRHPMSQEQKCPVPEA